MHSPTIAPAVFLASLARLQGARLIERPLTVARLARPHALACSLRCSLVRGRAGLGQTPVLWQSEALGRLLSDVVECR
jgi:hypothetical protein